MADVLLSKQKIKSGKTARLKEWMAEIQTREDEAIETLKHEGMHSEAAFLQRTEDGDFLVYYMEADDMDHVFEAYKQSDHEIDHEHREVLEDVLEDGSDVDNYELLYHLTNPDRP
jgi:hypothetical protein